MMLNVRRDSFTMVGQSQGGDGSSFVIGDLSPLDKGINDNDMLSPTPEG